MRHAEDQGVSRAAQTLGERTPGRTSPLGTMVRPFQQAVAVVTWPKGISPIDFQTSFWTS
jgi:hypothetical protein